MRTPALRPVRAPRVDGDRLPVRIRAIHPNDAPMLEGFYAALSPESRQTRFFSVGSALSHRQAVSFCSTDHDHREGFVAVLQDGPEGRERIVGHLCVEPDGADTAEVAIAVADAFQHQGIGRRLMAVGTAWARRERIARFTATMLVSNAPINRLLIGLGAPTRLRYVGGGVAEITIDLIGQSVAA